MPAACISLSHRGEKKRRATDVGLVPLRIKSGAWMLFSLAICHYIDRDCSFGSYVNKKARNQRPLCRPAGFTGTTHDNLRSIHRSVEKRQKILFPLFLSPERTIKFRIDAFPILYPNRKFELFANLHQAVREGEVKLP